MCVNIYVSLSNSCRTFSKSRSHRWYILTVESGCGISSLAPIFRVLHGENMRWLTITTEFCNFVILDRSEIRTEITVCGCVVTFDQSQ